MDNININSVNLFNAYVNRVFLKVPGKDTPKKVNYPGYIMRPVGGGFRRENGMWELTFKNRANLSNMPNKRNVNMKRVGIQFVSKNNGKIYYITRSNQANNRTFTMHPAGVEFGAKKIGKKRNREYFNASNSGNGVTYPQNYARVLLPRA